MGSQEDIRKDNLRAVLHHLRWNGPVTQRGLATATNLQPSTVSYLIRSLRDAGFVEEAGRTNPGPTGGKPGVQLQPRGQAGHYIGILLRRDQIVCSVVDFAGNPSSFDTKEIAVQTAHGFAPEVEGFIHSHLDASHGSSSRLLGIGIAAGSVVTQEGAIVPSADFPFSISDLPARLESIVPDVVIENDANATALYSLQQLAPSTDTLLALVFSEHPVSVGAGMIIHGQLYRGAAGAAGELMAPTSRGTAVQNQDVLATVVRFLDPDTVVLATDAAADGSTIPSTHHHITPGPSLARALQGRTVLTINNPRASVIGVAYLAYEKSIERVIQEVL